MVLKAHAAHTARQYNIQGREHTHLFTQEFLFSPVSVHSSCTFFYVSDGAGARDHNSLACFNSSTSLRLKSSQEICDNFLQLRFCLVRDLPFSPVEIM